MPSAVLNCQTFFKFWAFKAFSECKEKLSYQDRCRAQTAAIAFGILTLGIGTWICRACLYDRKIVRQPHARPIQSPISPPPPAAQIAKTPLEILKESRGNFSTFRETYREIKTLNPSLTIPTESKGSFFQIYILCSDILDALEIKDPQKRNDKLSAIKTLIAQLTGIPCTEFYVLLVKYCNIQDLPFLTTCNFDYSFKNDSDQIFRYVFEQSDEKKWKAALPCFWDCKKNCYICDLYPLFKTEANFRIVVQSILDHPNGNKNKFLTDCINYSFYKNLLPILEREQIVKNMIWPLCRELPAQLNNLNPNFLWKRCAREVIDLLKSDAENKFLIIQALEKLIIDDTVYHNYFHSLSKHLDAELLMKKAVHGGIRDLATLLNQSSSDFGRFRKKYEAVKVVLAKEKIENPFLNHPLDFCAQHLQTLTLACDLLDAKSGYYTCDKEHSILSTIKNQIDGSTSLSIHYLFEFLAKHCKSYQQYYFLERMPFDIEPAVKETFIQTCLNQDDERKWASVFAICLEEVNKSNKLVSMVLNRKKFPVLIQSLMERCFSTKNLNLYINYPYPRFPIPQRIEILKDCLWPQIEHWVSSDSPNWYVSPFDFSKLMGLESFFNTNKISLLDHLDFFDTQAFPTVFENIHERPFFPDTLSHLLRYLGRHTESAKAFMLTSKKNYMQILPLIQKIAKEETLKLIPLIKQVNAKRKDGKNLIEGIDFLENLINAEKSDTPYPPMAWIRLKNLLELALLEAIVTQKQLVLKQSS